MKRIALAAATALMLAGPLATTASAQDRNRGDQNDNRGPRGDDDRGRNDDRGDRSNNDRGRGDNGWDRGDRNDRGNDRRHQRWNGERHNGYMYQGRWNYGPPSAAYEGRNGYESGYRSWRRGERLPSYYQGRYRQVDYRREHLRAPPRGYRYVEDDRGDYLLVGIATGVILSIILSQ